MNGKRVLRALLLAGVVLLAGGCKLAGIVVEGGEVQSLGSGTCVAGNICVIDIDADDFSETFTAVPAPGWRFLRWNAGGDFFCKDLTSADCELSNAGFGGDPLLAGIIASQRTFYIMPVFERQPDIVTIGGKQWYQPDLFAELSWLAISAACPGGPCSGMLNGQDMSGWTWESVDGVNALFNDVIGFEALDGPGFHVQLDSTWAPLLLGHFRSDFTGADDVVIGWTRNLDGVDGRLGQVIDSPSGNEDIAATALTVNWSTSGAAIGAWFSRPLP